jgi:flagellar biosynthesis anti-sigma factor FlgM
MKIEGTRPDQIETSREAQQAQATERAQGGEARAAGVAGADRVELSSDARLMDSAVKAASSTPEIRQDLVERARQKLMSGELGRDVERLADRIIDHLLAR